MGIAFVRLKAGDIFDILKEKSDSMEETGKQMKVIVHEMEYKGGQMVSDLRLRHYSNSDYRKYRRVYEECFHEMRAALQRFPVDICASREKLEQEKGNIYILEVDGKLNGSVAIYGNEIDDMSISCRTNCICPPGAKHKCTERRDIPGSAAFVPSVAGLIIADEVVKDLCSEEMRQD